MKKVNNFINFKLIFFEKRKDPSKKTLIFNLFCTSNSVLAVQKINTKTIETNSGKEKNMIRKIKYILIVVCVAMSFTGIGLYFSLRTDTLKSDTTITLKDNAVKTLKAEIGGIYPGATQEYTINIGGKTSGDLYLTLSFRRDKDTAEKIEEYISVEITAGDERIEKTLSEFFAEENGTLLGKGVKTIKIAYTMLESAGNELQGAETTFYIDLKTERNTGK